MHYLVYLVYEGLLGFYAMMKMVRIRVSVVDAVAEWRSGHDNLLRAVW